MTSIASGPPGIEVAHQWGTFVLNDRSARPARVRLQRITGLHALGEVDDNRVTSSGQRGEVILPGARRGKTVVYEGSIQSKTLDALRTTTTAMLAAFREASDEGTMAILGSVTWFFRARVTDLAIDDEQTGGLERVWPFERTFTLTLRLSDSRSYVFASAASAGPFSSASSHVLTVAGGADVDPTFTVTGVPSLGDVEFYNGTLDRYLTFVDLPAGTLIVNFGERTATVGGVDVMAHLDVANSSWWWGPDATGLAPGANNVGVTGGSWSATWPPGASE
jgi:hypothetical protein